MLVKLKEGGRSGYSAEGSVRIKLLRHSRVSSMDKNVFVYLNYENKVWVHFPKLMYTDLDILRPKLFPKYS